MFKTQGSLILYILQHIAFYDLKISIAEYIDFKMRNAINHVLFGNSEFLNHEINFS